MFVAKCYNRGNNRVIYFYVIVKNITIVYVLYIIYLIYIVFVNKIDLLKVKMDNPEPMDRGLTGCFIQPTKTTLFVLSLFKNNILNNTKCYFISYIYTLLNIQKH